MISLVDRTLASLPVGSQLAAGTEDLRDEGANDLILLDLLEPGPEREELAEIRADLELAGRGFLPGDASGVVYDWLTTRHTDLKRVVRDYMRN